MNTFERFCFAIIGVILMLVAGVFMFLFWPFGIILAIFCVFCFVKACDKPQPEIIRRGSNPTATLEFGQAGPPVLAGTPPLQISGTTIFPTAIRSITFYPKSPPDLEVSPEGGTTTVPGSSRDHYSRLQLESLEEVIARGQDDIFMRLWVVQYVQNTESIAGKINPGVNAGQRQ